MPTLDLAPGGAPSALAERFEVGYVEDAGHQRIPLIKAWSVSFESYQPTRGLPSYKGQRHPIGQRWTATTGTSVGYESCFECDRLMLLDFDPDTDGATEHSAAWRSLAVTLEQALRLHRHTPGTLVELAEQLYQQTCGTIGSLLQLVRGAAVIAIDDETECITEDLFDLLPLDHNATQTTPARRRDCAGSR